MTVPNPILVTGLYDDHDASKGDGLNAYLKGIWHGWGIDPVTSVFDRNLAPLIPATGIIPVLCGHSFGGCAVVQLVNDLYAKGERRAIYVVLVDPVPRPNTPNLPFVLPPNVFAAYCIYRKTRSDGKTPITNYFSQPINNVAEPTFVNEVYIPLPGATHDKNGNPVDPQADEHGMPLRLPQYHLADHVKAFMALSASPPITAPAPDPSPVAAVMTLEQLTAAVLKINAKLGI